MKEKLTKRERLLRELSAAAEDIDEEGLVYLIEQASVLLHNARVRELEEKRAEVGAAQPPPRARGARASPTATVESAADGKSWFLVLGDVRKSLARAELDAIIRISVASPDSAEAARRLYHHLERERRDILADAGIAGGSNALLVALAEHLRARTKGGER